MIGLQSFMLESTPTAGSIETPEAEKKRFAAASLEWNVTQDKLFSTLFPEWVAKYEAQKGAAAAAAAAAFSSMAQGSSGGSAAGAASGSSGAPGVPGDASGSMLQTLLILAGVVVGIIVAAWGRQSS